MVDWIVLEFMKNLRTVEMNHVLMQLLIVSGLNGLSKANALQHVEEAPSNGSDINFKKRNMEDCHVVVIQYAKLNVVKSLVLFLLIVSGLHGAIGPRVLKHVEMDYKKEKGQNPQGLKMVVKNVLAITMKQDHVMKDFVQVKNVLK